MAMVRDRRCLRVKNLNMAADPVAGHGGCGGREDLGGDEKQKNGRVPQNEGPCACLFVSFCCHAHPLRRIAGIFGVHGREDKLSHATAGGHTCPSHETGCVALTPPYNWAWAL